MNEGELEKSLADENDKLNSFNMGFLHPIDSAKNWDNYSLIQKTSLIKGYISLAYLTLLSTAAISSVIYHLVEH